MNTAMDINIPRHQQAAAWADGLVEHVRWMDGPQREIFLTEAVQLAVEHLRPVELACAIDDEWLAQQILDHLKDSEQ